MHITNQITRILTYLGIPLGLLSILIVFITTSALSGNETLNLAITIDLLVTIPIVYFLLIRKSQIPKTTIVPVMVLGLIVGTYLLPPDQQTYLNIFKTWALPVIEVSVFILIIVKVRSAILRYKEHKSSTPDFYDTLKSVCYEMLPKRVALPFATEVAVFYYGFINWKRKTIDENEFTYHKNSGTLGLMGGFIFIIGIETFVLHHLLMDWSRIAAWISTGLSIYTAFQIFGFARAMSKRLISVENKNLVLRYSIMSEAIIPLAEIENVEKSTKSLDKSRLTHSLSPLSELESHNVVITVKDQQILNGLYGIKKSFKTLALHVDSPDEFINQIEAKQHI